MRARIAGRLSSCCLATRWHLTILLTEGSLNSPFVKIASKFLNTRASFLSVLFQKNHRLERSPCSVWKRRRTPIKLYISGICKLWYHSCTKCHKPFASLITSVIKRLQVDVTRSTYPWARSVVSCTATPLLDRSWTLIRVSWGIRCAPTYNRFLWPTAVPNLRFRNPEKTRGLSYLAHIQWRCLDVLHEKSNRKKSAYKTVVVFFCFSSRASIRHSFNIFCINFYYMSFISILILIYDGGRGQMLGVPPRPAFMH